MFSRTKPAQALQDRQKYIPPHIANAMAEHVQQSMPAHLKKYRGGNTYIPEHARNEIAQHLENALPSHMQQYAGAYMQQHVVEPSLAKRGAVAAPAPPDGTAAVPHAPVIHPDTQNLSAQPGVAAPVSGPVSPSTPQASYAEAAGQVASADQPYQFITNPQKPPRQSIISGLLGNAGLPMRVGVIAGGLVVLFILFSVFRSLLSNAPDVAPFITVAQEQQELIHLVSNSPEQANANLPLNTRNLTATMQASLTSSQRQTIQYLINNKKKIKEKQLNLKVSAATDTQLTNAAAAATYNQTFTEILQSKLNAYSKTLSQTYNQTKGKKGRALLSDSYRQAQLFQMQLNEPTN
jgi:hypothetical protein